MSYYGQILLSVADFRGPDFEKQIYHEFDLRGLPALQRFTRLRWADKPSATPKATRVLFVYRYLPIDEKKRSPSLCPGSVVKSFSNKNEEETMDSKEFKLFCTSQKALLMMALSAFLCILLFACAPFLDLEKASGITLHLDARSTWLYTGLRVEKDQILAFECRGRWAVAPVNESRRWPDTGPEGHGKHPGEEVHRKGDPKKELPGVPFGTLLGMVGKTVFAIGDQKRVIMPAKGKLYLVINDYPFFRHDNRGGLFIVIRKEGRRQ